MIKHVLMLAVIMGMASATQAQEMPQICETMFEMMRANAIEAGDQEAADELDVDGIRAEWPDLDEAERQARKADCEEIVELMKQAKAIQ